MSFNIRDYVSDDHIESIGEIAKSQSAIIQVLSLDNSQKDKEIERLNNIINEIEKDIKNLYTYGIKNNAEQRDYLLNRLQELKGDDKK